MDRRLLHPGADTKDIITQYIATIKCLRILDPPGVLLSRVADPIREYLRFVAMLLLVSPSADPRIVRFFFYLQTDPEMTRFAASFLV